MRRLPPPITFHFPRHLAHSARPLHCICVSKLLSPPFQRFIPTPTPTGLGCRARLHCGLPGNLHLLLRLVNDGQPLSELQRARSPYLRHVPPTHRGNNRIHYQPSALLYIVCDAALAPTPDVRNSRSINSTMAQCQPLHSLRVLSVEVNATPPPHISPRARCPALRRKVFSCVGGSAATSTDHAEFPPLLCPCTAVSRRIVLTAHRRHSTPRLDKSAPRESGCCREGQFPTNGNLPLTAAVLPCNGAYSARGQGSESETLGRAVGGA